jgi:hypothetical protein
MIGKRGILVLSACALTLAACATPVGEVDDARASWQGASYDDAVLAWGAPARTTKLSDGRPAHTWVSETRVARGVVYPSIGIFGGTWGSGVGAGVGIGSGGSELVRCERTLVFKNDRVVEQSWTGPAEYCSQFRHGQQPSSRSAS